MRANIAGGNDAEACRHAEGKLQKDVYNRGNVVDTRDLLAGERLPDDGSVADGIDLLEKIRKNDREGKAQNGFPARTFCQVNRLEQRRKPLRGRDLRQKQRPFRQSEK